MYHLSLRTIFSGLAGLLLLLGQGTAAADTVKLKSGTQIEGRIVTETADMVIIEVQTTPTIKEKKTLKMEDVESITRQSPDDLAYQEIKEQLPIPSLWQKTDYQKFLSTGPESFVNKYPDSPYRDEVQKILEETKEELSMVEDGHIKLEGEWIDPEYRRTHSDEVDARIAYYYMRVAADAGRYIDALRQFQKLEEIYYGTDAFLKSIETAKEVLPAYGQRLEQILRNVDLLNKQRDEEKKYHPEDELARLEAAYKREEEAHVARNEQERSQGIRWLSINERSKQSLEDALAVVKAEYDRVKALDTAALKAQTEGYDRVEKLIEEDKLVDAKKELAAINKSRIEKSLGSKTSESPIPYAANLAQQIKDREAAIAAEREEARKKMSESERLLSQIGGTPGATEAPPAEGETPEGEEALEQAQSAGDALAAAIAARSTVTEEPKAATPKPGSTKKPKKSAAKPKPAAAEDEPPKPRASSGGGGGGISFMMIMYIIGGLMLVTVVVMKVMGVGGGKAA